MSVAVSLPLVVGWAGALLLASLDGRKRWVGWLGVTLALALFSTLVVLAVEVGGGAIPATVSGDWPLEVGIRLRADALSTLFALVSSGLLAVVLAFEVSHGPESRFFPALVLFLGTGLTGLFLTADAFNFYVFFELAMISSFALAGYGGGRPESRAAAVFVVINLLGSVFFLGAVAALYRVTGTLDMAAIGREAQSAAPGAVLLVGALLLVAFGLKLGLFPFHYWLPVVYRDTRPAVAAVFAGALANLGVYGLLRFGVEVLPGVLPAARPMLYVLGLASIVYGGVYAVHRRALRDVLAYSAIGQVGYTVVALALGGPVGAAAAVVYGLMNSLHKTALFLGAGTRGTGTAAAVLVAGLSVAGLPPSGGFVGKVAIFRAGAEGGSAVVLALLVAGGALSLVYMLQAWQCRFWVVGSQEHEGAGEAAGSGSPMASRLLVALLVGAVVALGVWPGPMIEWCDRAAAALEPPR